jgi:hypothetical protein
MTGSSFRTVGALPAAHLSGPRPPAVAPAVRKESIRLDCLAGPVSRRGDQPPRQSTFGHVQLLDGTY